MNKYQDRYLEHQKRKKELLELMAKRESLRDLKKGVDPEFYEGLDGVLDLCPSSCDRKAIITRWFDDRKHLEIIGGLLKGGVGWAHRADRIVLLFGEKEAYAGINEVSFMPYLDAGVCIQQAYLYATANDVKCCFINPSCNDLNYLQILCETDGVFCGALAFGK